VLGWRDRKGIASSGVSGARRFAHIHEEMRGFPFVVAKTASEGSILAVLSGGRRRCRWASRNPSSAPFSSVARASANGRGSRMPSETPFSRLTASSAVSDA
jgi:hypothetical protein